MSVARRPKWTDSNQPKIVASDKSTTMAESTSPRRRIFSSSGPNASTSAGTQAQRTRAASSSTSNELKVQISGIKKKQTVLPSYSLRKGKSPATKINTTIKSNQLLTKIASEAKLERVLGCTACPSSIAIDRNSGLIAFAAGSTVVLQNGQHQTHLVNNSKNNITCLDIAPNGKYLATGEFGNRPMVRVWELGNGCTHTGVQVAELAEHNLGILVVKFTSDSNQLFSVGSQHDKNVVLWDWRRQVKAASGKITNQVNAAALSTCGTSFVTVGVRHVKFWTVGSSEKFLPGKSAILNTQRNNTFLDVCCASENRTFVLNDLKRLIEFRNKQIHDIYELDGGVPKALCMGPENNLFIGFTNGIIRVLDIEQWNAKTLPGRPHHLRHDIAAAPDLPAFFGEVAAATTHGATFPDVRALLFHQSTSKLTAFYTDRSFYQWHLMDFDTLREGITLSNRFHVGAILDMEIVSKPTAWLPAGTFITSGVDYTIRFWSMDKDGGPAGILTPNVLSPELKKVLYLAEDDKLLHDPADSHSGMIFSDPLDSTTGAKCLRLSPDGKHLASGFRDGNLIVFDVTSADFNPLINIDAHEGETMCVEYADPGTSDGRVFLASGGRDRLIHVFDAENEYTHLSTLDDHSSSVVSVRFIPEDNGYKMFTCATDRLIVIRRLVYDVNGGSDVSLERLNQISINSGPNYLVIAPEGNALMLACQDRQLRTYSITGKPTKAIKGTLCEEGMLTKLALDPSGTYAATICSDRYVYIIDVASGECAAVLNGQTDCVTSIAFTPDCRRLVVVSHSGCVFVWRLSTMLTKRMTAKMGGASLMASSLSGDHRSTTPDSLIESGSDSASLVKDARPGLVNASGSEFGSLTSCQIGHDDDLDSGVGGARQTLSSTASDSHNLAFAIDSSVHGANLDDSVGPFEIRRVEHEVKRRTSSSCLNEAAAAGFDPDTGSEAPELDMLSSAAANPSSTHGHPQYPSAYAPSRSMSSLHRNNASPQRIRKKWHEYNAGGRPGAPMSTVIGIGSNNDYGNVPPTATSTPGEAPTGLPYQYQHASGPSQNHVYQQPGQHHHAGGGGLSSSVSLHGLRSINNYDNLPPMNSTPKNSFAPIPSRQPSNMHVQGGGHGGHGYQGSPYAQQHQHHGAGLNDSGTFDRSNASRNSLTKKYMNMSVASDATDASPKIWTPQRFEPSKRPSNLFGTPVTPLSSIHRRQSERVQSAGGPAPLPTTFGSDTTPRRLFTRNPSSNASGSSTNLVMSGGIDDSGISLRRKPIDRTARRRQTVSAYADINAVSGDALMMSGPLAESTPMSPPLNVLEEEDYESSSLHLRSTSQSPSTLMLNTLGTESGTSRSTLRKNSDFGSTLSRVTPSSSRVNLRTAGSSSQMNRSNQALNRMLEAREKLKKSQENLAYAMNGGDEPQSPTSSSAMARSRSIGNLRGGRNGEGGNDVGFGGYDENVPLNDQKRQMTRSVTSLHNNNMNEGFMHPDECTLQAQYGASGRRQSSSRFAGSIRNLQKLSNSDLTNTSLYDDAGPNDSNTSTATSTGAPSYFSTTLPKSMRKGAVSKRVFKATAAARDQNSESDSNASDQTPPISGGAYVKQSPANGFRIAASPLRSASSIEPGRVAVGRRMFDAAPRKSNYLAQKFQAGGDHEALSNMGAEKQQNEFENVLSNNLNAHIFECSNTFTEAINKVIQAKRQMSEYETRIPSGDFDKLLRKVDKVISEGINRLAAVVPEPLGSDASLGKSGRLSSSSTPTATTTASPSPTSMTNTSTNDEPVVNAAFIERYGPEIMNLLKNNLAKRN